VSRELRLERVAVALGGRPVLRGVDLAVGPGEVVGLLGANGAGKTTLLRVASGVLAPDAGEVRLGGVLLASIGRRARARAVAALPQDTHVPFPFSAAEIVLMGRAPHLPWFGLEGPDDVERARAAMRRAGVESLADRSVLSLSGGERQLVLFARALAQEPELLLLDEPTSHLDLSHRVDVLRAVRSFSAQGGGALVVSHDLGLAARACDRLALLRNGAIVADGPPGAVLRPDALRESFGIDAAVLDGPDGAPVVVPRL
jgi:iron complex transport system ATP-binding protein